MPEKVSAAKTAFLIEAGFGMSICEINYEKRTRMMLVGVRKVRDIVGNIFYVANRVLNAKCFDTLEEAATHARDLVGEEIRHAESEVTRWRNIDAAIAHHQKVSAA